MKIPKAFTTIARLLFPIGISLFPLNNLNSLGFFYTVLCTVLIGIALFLALGKEQLEELADWGKMVWGKAPIRVIIALRWCVYLTGLGYASLIAYVMTLLYVQNDILNSPIENYFLVMAGWAFIGVLWFIMIIYLGNQIKPLKEYS